MYVAIHLKQHFVYHVDTRHGLAHG